MKAPRLPKGRGWCARAAPFNSWESRKCTTLWGEPAELTWNSYMHMTVIGMWLNLGPQKIIHMKLWVRLQACCTRDGDLRSTSSLEHTKYQCVDCHCSAVTMPIWSAMWPVRQRHPFSWDWIPCSFCLVKYLAMCCCKLCKHSRSTEDVWFLRSSDFQQ